MTRGALAPDELTGSGSRLARLRGVQRRQGRVAHGRYGFRDRLAHADPGQLEIFQRAITVHLADAHCGSGDPTVQVVDSLGGREVEVAVLDDFARWLTGGGFFGRVTQGRSECQAGWRSRS